MGFILTLAFIAIGVVIYVAVTAQRVLNGWQPVNPGAITRLGVRWASWAREQRAKASPAVSPPEPPPERIDENRDGVSKYLADQAAKPRKIREKERRNQPPDLTPEQVDARAKAARRKNRGWTPPAVETQRPTAQPSWTDDDFDDDFDDEQEAGMDGLTDQLDRREQMFRRGTLSKSDYMEILQAGLTDIDTKEDEVIEAFAEGRMTLAAYNAFEKEADAMRAEIDRRKDVAEAWDVTEAQDERWYDGEDGKWCRFEYVDNSGVVSNRNVTMWSSRGRYIVGYDRDKKGERTFRKERISNWVCG